MKNKNTYKNRKGMQELKKKQWIQGQTLKYAKYGKCTYVTNALLWQVRQMWQSYIAIKLYRAVAR